MIEWLISVSGKCRELCVKAEDAAAHLEKKEEDAAKKINGYMKTDLAALVSLWKQVDPEMVEAPPRLSDLARHIRFGMPNDYADVIAHDLPNIQEQAEKMARERAGETKPVGFEDLLHPRIVDSALDRYTAGFLREAVLNGVMAVMDLIRARTGLQLDGAPLVQQAFNPRTGKLIFSELDTENGQNDQKGFMMIYEGVYGGVRNVKAHSLDHDLNEQKAGQYLVMLSLLARRVDECKIRI